jgi:hypothetical protein
MELRRKQRDGWTVVKRLDAKYERIYDDPPDSHVDGPKRRRRYHKEYVMYSPQIMKRTVVGVTLISTYFLNGDGKGDEEIVLQDSKGSSWVLTGATWADFDQRGRVIFFRDGCVFAVEAMELKGLVEKKLADFNENSFKAIKAPEWAVRWPEQIHAERPHS